MKKNFLLMIATFSCLSSCIVYDSKIAVVFKNCTNDTLLIGASHYNNIDSVVSLVPSEHSSITNNIDATNFSLWKNLFISNDDLIYPDSSCIIDGDFLFRNTDTCYFFLIKWKDVRKNTWDEIYNKKLFTTWIVTKDINGRFNRNIAYE